MTELNNLTKAGIDKFQKAMSCGLFGDTEQGEWMFKVMSVETDLASSRLTKQEFDYNINAFYTYLISAQREGLNLIALAEIFDCKPAYVALLIKSNIDRMLEIDTFWLDDSISDSSRKDLQNKYFDETLTELYIVEDLNHTKLTDNAIETVMFNN